MKSNLLCFFMLVLFGLSTYGQATIQSDVVFSLGESSTVHQFHNYFVPGAAGPNQSWDFSALSGNTTMWDWVAQNPDTSILRDSFPSASLMFRTPQGDTAESYVFYQLANDLLDFHGAAIIRKNSGDTLYQMMDRNPMLTLAFPFTYQDVQQDTFGGVNWVKFGGMIFEQSRDGHLTHTVDAYGQITTPFGTFNDVIRVKTVEQIEDTLKTIIPVASRQVNTRYAWYAAGEKYLLMQMDSLAIIQPGFSSVVTYAQYRSSEVSTSIKEDQFAEDIQLTIYPNPASERLVVRSQWEKPTPVSISLQNAIGQELYQVKMENAFGELSHTIPLTQIGAGVYIVRIESKEGVAAKKVSVLR